MESQVLSYDRASSLDVAAGRLQLETSGGVALRAPSPHPRFFDGTLVHPLVAASCLRQVAQVAAASYVRREREPGGLDPVVTSDGARLRFESFSLCGGVLARLDVLPDGLDGDVLDRGTTNVDINEPLRRMLTRVSARGLLHLSVGTEGLVATTESGAVVEHKVALPERWLRGFRRGGAHRRRLRTATRGVRGRGASFPHRPGSQHFGLAAAGRARAAPVVPGSSGCRVRERVTAP